jgi:raffinose/stachyose/melibiose transport system permease protein
MKVRKGLKSIPGHTILFFLAVVQLFPIALVFINSFKTSLQVAANPLSLPTGLDFSNYATAWQYGHFSTGFVNSILLVATTVVVVLVCASLAGYVLAGKKIRTWPLVTIYFLVAVTIPIWLFLFPMYFAYSKLHLLNNPVAVGFIVAAINLPLAVFLMRAFFLKVPASLEEAAIVDGAGTARLLWSVMLPIISPGLLTVGILVGLVAWNEYLITTTFLQTPSSYTATLGYLTMNGTFTDQQGIMMAGAVILILPVILIFIAVQRFFIDGFVSGAVKG